MPTNNRRFAVVILVLPLLLLVVSIKTSMSAQTLVPHPEKIIITGPSRLDVAALQPLVDYEYVISNTATMTQTFQLTIDGSELISIHATSTHNGVVCTPRAKLVECSLTLRGGDSAVIHFVAHRFFIVYSRIKHCIAIRDVCLETLIVALPYPSWLPIIINT